MARKSNQEKEETTIAGPTSEDKAKSETVGCDTRTSINEKTAKVLEKINESVDAVTDGVAITKRHKTDDNIPLDDDIACKSVTFGGLTWISPKTNSYFRWNNIGDIEFIPFSELVTLNNTKRDFLFKPYFIVQDERVVKYFRLLDTYEKVAQIHNLEEVFAGNIRDIESVIDIAISVNMRGLMISKVRQMRKEGVLTNIDIIKLLEAKLKFDLSDDNVSETK